MIGRIVRSLKYKFIPIPQIRITYGITVCNEAKELSTLLAFLTPHLKPTDDIVILSDKDNVTSEVLSIIDQYVQQGERIKHISYSLNNDFATFKNHLIEYAKGDYLFQLDADEIPNSCLINRLKHTLAVCSDCDCFFVPRVNRVEGITEQHIQKWNWQIDDIGRINYPDFQTRIFKLNGTIKWIKPVHETLINYQKRKKLRYKNNENYCLYHIKTIERQDKQNTYYDEIEHNKP